MQKHVLFICSNQWNSDVWGEISSLKSRLVEANTNPCSEIRDLICCRLIYRRENTITYPELVRHIMNLCLLLLMDILKTLCLASGSCGLAYELVKEGIYLFRNRLIPSTSLSSWDKFLASLKLKRSTLGSLCELSVVWGLGHRVTAAMDPVVVVRSVPHCLSLLFLVILWYFCPQFPTLQCIVTAVSGSWGCG